MRHRSTPSAPTLSRKAAVLHNLAPFARCSPAELEAAATLVDESRRPAGAPLTRQGGLGAEVFVLISGTVAVTRDGVHLATLTAGDVLGEMALLEGGTRSATATCVTDTSFLVMDPRAFASLLDRPSIAKAVLAVADSRLPAIAAAPEPAHGPV